MINVKATLHEELRFVRGAVLAKLDGLSEYDVRRPLTPTGTNLLGLVKHLATWEARYFGEVFDRPFPRPLPPRGTDLWATEHESRTEVVEFYRSVWAHTDATIEGLPLDAPGRVSWWRKPEVTLFGVLLHMITETTRHAGHADILRESIDGAVGVDGAAPPSKDAIARCAAIESAARAAQA
nr:DinB family protein [Labedaea rhizosphaerae]